VIILSIRHAFNGEEISRTHRFCGTAKHAAPHSHFYIAHALLLIGESGNWWQATDGTPFKVAVNLSATTIQKCDLAALVSEAAEASGVCVSVLDIEVTETAVMSDFAAASRALSAVRRIGVTYFPQVEDAI
jgi:EAL domain-containing protein (putative c-di-GMP-specific phosphodiesterase class I)